MAKKSIIINPLDNVAVALTDLVKGDIYEGVTLTEDITKGHKFALRPIKEGENIIKYGTAIAHATRDIVPGEHVHTHNVATNLNENLEYVYEPVDCTLPAGKMRKVNVYRRANGEVGIRNELWVIPTVGCVNGQAKEIVDTFRAPLMPDGKPERLPVGERERMYYIYEEESGSWGVMCWDKAGIGSYQGETFSMTKIPYQ